MVLLVCRFDLQVFLYMHKRCFEKFHLKTHISSRFSLLQDARFNNEIDLKTGYKTNSILCMPICNYEGEVIGVAQIINKTNECNEFSPHDVEVFQRYLTFCGIGIQNAQLFEISVLEYKRNQVSVQYYKKLQL